MKNRSKSLVLMSIVFGGLTLSGCVGEYYYDDGWVESEYVYVPDSPCSSCQSYSDYMDITVQWNGCRADIDAELITPYHGLVDADSGIVDGCYHLGDDLGQDGDGVEEIICDGVVGGTYTLRLIDQSDFSATPTVSIRKLKHGTYEDRVIDSTVDTAVEAWGLTELSITF